jgi:hypothetical protein
MRLISVIAIPVFLAGCAARQPAPQADAVLYTPYTLSKAELDEIKKKVSSMMKDPESARFSDISAVRYGNMVDVCGLLNAKNSYGGYVGYHAFFGSLTLPQHLFFPIGVGSEHASDGASRSMCRERGILLP